MFKPIAALHADPSCTQYRTVGSGCLIILIAPVPQFRCSYDDCTKTNSSKNLKFDLTNINQDCQYLLQFTVQKIGVQYVLHLDATIFNICMKYCSNQSPTLTVPHNFIRVLAPKSLFIIVQSNRVEIHVRDKIVFQRIV